MATNKITQQLYNGEVLIDFFPDSHRYKLAGRKDYLVSVTAATGVIDKSAVLMGWAVGLACGHLRSYLGEQPDGKFTAEELLPVIDEAGRQHTIKKDEAASIGNQVHDFAQKFAEHKMTGSPAPELTEEMEEGVVLGITGFLDWYAENKPEFIANEKLIYSRAYEYCGKFDVLAKINGEIVLLDYKTSSGVYPEHFFQLSGYWQAYAEEYPDQAPARAMILHFDKKTGAFSVKGYASEDQSKYFGTFLACLTLKKALKAMYSF